MKTLKRELKLKDGTVFPVGTEANLRWEERDSRLTVLTINGRDIKIPTARLYVYFNISKPPTFRTLEKWSFDGIARSVLGKKVEPDGHDEFGSPSWLLVAGLI